MIVLHTEVISCVSNGMNWAWPDFPVALTIVESNWRFDNFSKKTIQRSCGQKTFTFLFYSILIILTHTGHNIFLLLHFLFCKENKHLVEVKSILYIKSLCWRYFWTILSSLIFYNLMLVYCPLKFHDMLVVKVIKNI